MNFRIPESHPISERNWELKSIHLKKWENQNIETPVCQKCQIKMDHFSNKIENRIEGGYICNTCGLSYITDIID